MNGIQWIKRVIGLSLCFLCQISVAQVPFFERYYTHPGVDICFSVSQLNDSSVYLFGYSENGSIGGYDFSLMKVKPDGTPCWTKYYGTPQVDFGLFMNNADSSNLILIGTTQNLNPGLADDVLLIKVDSAGQVIWSQVIGSFGNESCRYVEQTADKGFICCGVTPDPFGYNDAWVVKTDSLGNVEWTNIFGGVDNDVAARVVATSPSTWAMTCDTKVAGNGSYDVQVIGLDAGGNQTFDHIHADSLTNGCQGMFFTSTGRIISFGETEISPGSYFDFLIHVFDETGNPVRTITFGGIGAEAMFDMIETNSGDYIGTGYTNSSSNAQLPINLALMKMDTLGNLIWFREFGGNSIDIGYRIIPGLGGGYYVAGRTSQTDEEFYLLHFDENGFTGFRDEEEANNSYIKIWPNPAHLNCRVSVDFEVEKWEIIDATGRIVFSEKSSGEKFKSLNTSHINVGMYHLRAVGKKSSAISRLLIAR